MTVLLTVERMTALGEGVASHEGRTVFVDGAFTGETVHAEIREDGRVLRGQLVELVQPSPHRREPPCSLAGTCGGCDWMHVSERAQRQAKDEAVLSALEHLGGLRRETFEVRPTLASPSALGYRRRAVLHRARGGFGFFGRRSHDLVVIPRCPALVHPLQELPGELFAHLAPIAQEIDELHLLAEGEKRAIALFLKGNVKPRINEIARKLKLAGVVLVPKDGSPVVVGKPALRSDYPLRPEVPVYSRPDAFSQANAEGNVGLVATAVQQLAARGSEAVLELYCGNGNFTFAIAGTAASVLGVESGAVSLELAQRSAREGGVSNVRFVQGDAQKVCEGLIQEKRHFDLILADPPRTGASGLAKWSVALGAKRVLYVACDVGSLARDGAELARAGFAAKVLQIVDMFPQTHHAEVVMTFER
ncbi:MAG: class I SAM-dependent RNA methyltransferase [Myxococcaceae bacterium]